MKCPPPPQFEPGSVVGTWDLKGEPKESAYKDEVQYSCPEGYVFQIYQDNPNPCINHGLILPETDIVKLKCAAWGDWNPPKVPLCIPKVRKFKLTSNFQYLLTS